MQPARTLGLAFLLLLIVGAGAFWLLDRDDAPLPPPGSAGQTGTTPQPNAPVTPVEAEATRATTADAAARTERTAAATDLPPTDGPAITGRVVDAQGQPLADVEVACMPGMFFSGDFSSFDFGDLGSMAELGRAGPGGSLDPRTWIDQRVSFATDTDGRFRVNARGTTKTVGVRLLERGYRVLDRNVRRPETADIDLGTLTLERGGVVAGRVVDTDGAPIADATVALVLAIEKQFGNFAFAQQGSFDRGRVGETAITGADGRFELASVPAGEIDLRVNHDAHPAARKTGLMLAAGQELRDVLITMPRGAEIRGRAIDLPDDDPNGRAGIVVMAAAKPKADASPVGMMGLFGGANELMSELGMQIGEQQADIAADGTFVLRGLRVDSGYRLWLSRVDPNNPMAALGACSERLEAAPGRSDVELRYDPGVVVTATLVDDVSGAPVQRVFANHRLVGDGGLGELMAMQNRRNKALMLGEGRLVIDDLRPKPKQKLTVQVEAIGYEPWQRDDIELPTRGTVDLGVVRLSPRPVLQVQVLDDRSGQPVADAQVRVGRAGQGGNNPFAQFAAMAEGEGTGRARTDRDGRCTLNLPDGEAELSVESKQHAPFVLAIAPTAAAAQEATVRLLVGGEVAVTVVEESGAPVAGAAVEHRTPDGNNDRQKTDEAGVARFAHLTPGQHEFRLAQGDGGLLDMAMRSANARVRRGNNADDNTWNSATGLGDAPEPEEQPWLAVAVADQASASCTLTKATAAVLTGIVRENGVPLADAKVQFAEGPGAGEADVVQDMVGGMLSQLGGGGSKRTAKSDELGAYRLADLPAGEHRLRITHASRAMTTTVAVTLQQGANALDLQLDASTLRGVVLDPEGNPVSGARIRVSPSPTAGDASALGTDLAGSITESMLPGMSFGGTTIKSDDFGQFVLKGVTPDTPLRVRATAKGFAPTFGEASVARGEDQAGFELRLGAAGKIRVVVADPPGFAMAMATYAGDDQEEDDPIAPVLQMLRKGKGTLDGLRPGTWQVRLQSMNRGGGGGQSGNDDNERTVVVVAGETVQVDF